MQCKSFFSLLWMTETGILAYYQTNWERANIECPKTEIKFIAIDLYHFSSALYVLLIGYVCSLISLIVEILYWRKRKRTMTDIQTVRY